MHAPLAAAAGHEAEAIAPLHGGVDDFTLQRSKCLQVKGAMQELEGAGVPGKGALPVGLGRPCLEVHALQ